MAPLGALRARFFFSHIAAISPSLARVALATPIDALGIGGSCRTEDTEEEKRCVLAWMCGPHGRGWLECVGRLPRHQVPSHGGGFAFEAAFARFAELKQGKSVKYQRGNSKSKSTFSALMGRLMCDDSARDLEPILDKLAAGSRNAKMRRLRSVSNLAIKREWMLQGASPTSLTAKTPPLKHNESR
jgi:hypothetical protein